MHCNYNSFIQIINVHGLLRNAPRCRKTGACRILVPLRYMYWKHTFHPHAVHSYLPSLWVVPMDCYICTHKTIRMGLALDSYSKYWKVKRKYQKTKAIYSLPIYPSCSKHLNATCYCLVLAKRFMGALEKI